MRLAAFTRDGAPGWGIVSGDGEAAEIRAFSEIDGMPGDIAALLAAGPDGMAAARAAADRAPAFALGDVRLAAPIPRPPKVLAIGLNYRAHVAETGREVSPHQIWFSKQRTCITGPFDPIDKPAASDMVDYEGELVAVIGRRCRHVPAARAFEVIAGYMAGNDVSVRDWQRRTPTMMMGKGFDTHGPTGPWIVTADEIADPQALSVTTRVNAEVRQQGSTGDMIHPLAAQIEHLTTAFTLEPGDLIFTGTPEGVGAAMDPPSFLKAGDRVRISISQIGEIENPVVDEVAATLIR